jgi:predicted outer membrane repeat protein
MWTKKSRSVVAAAIMVASMMLAGSGLHAPRVAVAATLTDTTCTAASYANDVATAVPGETITFNCASSAQIVVAGTTNVTYPGLTITSSGAAVTLDGGSTIQVFNVTSGTLTLDHLTIANGHASGGGGGGVHNDGQLVISNSTFSGNTARGAESGNGGAIYNSGNLSIVRSSFLGNTATSQGGALYSVGTVNITDSAFSGNSGYISGGALDILYGARANVSNSTFSGNTAPFGDGGAIDDYFSTVNITNATISGNSAQFGGAIRQDTITMGAVNIANSIVANNSALLVPNCYGYGSPIDLGYNLESGTDCHFTSTGSKQNTDPMLGALASNGGPTQTMALLAGSPAIDTIPVASCLASDQRGNPRPDSASETACDMGAYESGEDADLALSGVPESFSVNATSPAGAVVSYSLPTVIDEDAILPTVDCSPAPGSTFVIGVTTVTCTVTDPDDTNSPVTQSFTVTVNGAAAQLGGLVTTVTSYNLSRGLQTSLVNQLQAARAAVEANNQTAACGVIGAFLNYVEAQSGKRLTSAQATQLLTDAQRINAVLAC